VNLSIAHLKPKAAALAKAFRLWDLQQSKQSAIKFPRGAFATGWYGDLCVMQADDGHYKTRLACLRHLCECIVEISRICGRSRLPDGASTVVPSSSGPVRQTGSTRKTNHEIVALGNLTSCSAIALLRSYQICSEGIWPCRDGDDARIKPS